jgi:hypothetical protein
MKENRKWSREGEKITWREGRLLLSSAVVGGGGDGADDDGFHWFFPYFPYLYLFSRFFSPYVLLLSLLFPLSVLSSLSLFCFSLLSHYSSLFFFLFFFFVFSCSLSLFLYFLLFLLFFCLSLFFFLFFSVLSSMLFCSRSPLSCAPFFVMPPCFYRQKQGRDVAGVATVLPPHNCLRGTFPPFFTAPW